MTCTRAAPKGTARFCVPSGRKNPLRGEYSCEGVTTLQGWYERKHRLCTADVDRNGEWRASAIFIDMQEAGGEHSERNGLGMRALRERDLAWVLSRVWLKLERVPVLGDEVTVRTWPGAPRHFFCPRYYAFFVEGEQVGAASTLYVQLNLTTRAMAKPWLSDGDWLNCDVPPSLALPGNLPRFDEPADASERTARYADLDVNGHVNNARYLDWYCDCFGDAFHRQNRLREALVHYNREVLPDERVTLALQKHGDACLLQGTAEGASCFGVYGVWEARADGRDDANEGR